MNSRVVAALTAIVVDDEPLACEELEFLLRDFPEIDIAATGTNGLEAVELIERLEPDIVFMDVQMPGLDGLGVIRRLREKNIPLPHFVFATAYDNYAVEAFQLEAVDYLLKPVDRDRLQQTVTRVTKLLQDKAKALAATEAVAPLRPALQRTKLLVKYNNRNLIVDAQDVIYATIQDGLITVVTVQFEGQSNYRTIEELQSNLDPDTFWRAHRSYLVNIHRIREVIPWFNSSYQLRMDDKKQTEVPVSRVQTKRLRALLKL